MVMRSGKVAVALAAFLLVAVLPAWGRADPVRVGVYDNPPKLLTTEDGETSGFFPELIRAVALREGWEVEFVQATWPELLDALEAGEIDLLPDVAYSDERAGRFVFNREPVLSAWSTLYVPKGRAKRII